MSGERALALRNPEETRRRTEALESSKRPYKPLLFSAENQPAGQRGRKKKSVLYEGQIRELEDRMADSLPAIAEEKLKIALGLAEEAIINHKTGEITMVPVNPATQLKAIESIENRIAGKPVDVKQLEVGEGAQGVFQVLLGAAAEEHWKKKLAESQAPPSLEASVTVHEPE